MSTTLEVEQDQLAMLLASSGFNSPEPGMYMSYRGEGWSIWVSYSSAGGSYRNLGFGICNSSYTEKLTYSLQAFSANQHNLVREDYLYPLFLVQVSQLRSVLFGEKNYAPLEHPNINQIASETIGDYQSYLSKNFSFDSCLDCLEQFSSSLPMYQTSRLVMLRLLGRTHDFEILAEEWLRRMAAIGAEGAQGFIDRLKA